MNTLDYKVFMNMSYGVYVVSCMDKQRPTGCTANSIMQITVEPATVAVSINHDNYTCGCIEESGRFAFSILGEQSDPGLIGRFGFRSGRDTDKFEGLEYEMAEGLPVLKDSCGYVACKVVNKMETATHTVFLGEVIATGTFEGAGRAMTYAYYHEVIKGKSPKNAPTYLQEEKKAEDKPGVPGEAGLEAEGTGTDGRKAVFVCRTCGYIYEGSSLPPDYICPVCKKGAEQFEQRFIL